MKSDPGLLQTCLTQVNEALLQGLAPQNTGEAFLEDFKAQLQVSLADRAMRVVAAEPSSYRLRCTIEAEGCQGRIDFHFDGKQRWTRASEVGSPASSQDIFQRVQETLALAT